MTSDSLLNDVIKAGLIKSLLEEDLSPRQILAELPDNHDVAISILIDMVVEGAKSARQVVKVKESMEELRHKVDDLGYDIAALWGSIND